MSKTFQNIFLFCLFVLGSGCSKGDLQLSFLKPHNSYELVVEGGINTFQRTQFIRLSKPAFHPDSFPVPVSNAKVEVSDGKNVSVFKETKERGVYSGIVNNNTNYNKAYKLIIQYNNKEYTATDTLRQVVNIIDDYLPLSIMKNLDGNTNGIIPRHTFGNLYSSRWLIAYDGIPLWNPSNFDNMLYYSYTHFLGSPNSQYPLTDQNREFELSPSSLITIYKFSLSESYARYLYSVFLETEWKGIFSGVPGKVTGNISGNAQGYFYVTDVDIRRYKVSELLR